MTQRSDTGDDSNGCLPKDLPRGTPRVKQKTFLLVQLHDIFFRLITVTDFPEAGEI